MGKWHVILVSSAPDYDWETCAQLRLVQSVFIESKTLENKDEWGDYDTVEGTDITLTLDLALALAQA